MGMFISALCSCKQNGSKTTWCPISALGSALRGNIIGSHSKFLTLVILALHILQLAYLLSLLSSFSSPWPGLPYLPQCLLARLLFAPFHTSLSPSKYSSRCTLPPRSFDSLPSGRCPFPPQIPCGPQSDLLCYLLHHVFCWEVGMA